MGQVKECTKPCIACNGEGEVLAEQFEFKRFGNLDIMIDCGVCDGLGYTISKYVLRKKEKQCIQNGKTIAESALA